MDFRILATKFVKFLMSVLKWKVNSSSNFALFFIVMTHKTTVNLQLIHFQFWTKVSYQSSNFDTFDCSGQNLQNSSCHFPSKKSVFLQILHHSSMSWKIMSLLCTFLAQTIYTLLKKSPLKLKFLRLSSARVIFCQIPYANFKTTSRFLYKFCIPLQFHEK